MGEKRNISIYLVLSRSPSIVLNISVSAWFRLYYVGEKLDFTGRIINYFLFSFYLQLMISVIQIIYTSSLDNNFICGSAYMVDCIRKSYAPCTLPVVMQRIKLKIKIKLIISITSCPLMVKAQTI